MICVGALLRALPAVVRSWNGHVAAPNSHWRVKTQGISPRIPVIDKLKRTDGTFSGEDFIVANHAIASYALRQNADQPVASLRAASIERQDGAR